MARAEFEGRVAVVTGGASGIGFAIARLLSERGATVAFWDLDGGAAAAAASKLAGARHARVDVTDELSILAARDALLADCGRCDILINKAGIYPHATIREITVEAWDRMFDVDVKSVFLVTRALMDAMIGQRYGRVVTIVSEDAYMAKPSIPHYAAAKAALLSLIRSFAAELAPHQVLCNGLASGPVATERAKSQAWLAERIPKIPVLRAAEPEDMAEYAVFLASDRNRFMAGETIVANGGYIMV